MFFSEFNLISLHLFALFLNFFHQSFVSYVDWILEFAFYCETIAEEALRYFEVICVMSFMAVIKACLAHSSVPLKPTLSALIPLLLHIFLPICYVCANAFNNFILRFRWNRYLLLLFLDFGLFFFFGLSFPFFRLSFLFFRFLFFLLLLLSIFFVFCFLLTLLLLLFLFLFLLIFLFLFFLVFLFLFLFFFLLLLLFFFLFLLFLFCFLFLF